MNFENAIFDDGAMVFDMGDDFLFVEVGVVKEHLVLVVGQLKASLPAYRFAHFCWLAK